MEFVHVPVEFTPFYILHNVIKIRNNSSEPAHHHKQNLFFNFHILGPSHLKKYHNMRKEAHQDQNTKNLETFTPHTRP
jgi:hypothetical protein